MAIDGDMIMRLLEITQPKQYKLHAARWNGHNNPLDVYLDNDEDWHNWNRWYGKKHEFNRQFVLSFMDFYPERHIWLFGGIYEITNYRDRPLASQDNSYAYHAVLTNQAKDLIGRLKVGMDLKRGRSFLLENQIGKMNLNQIMRAPYTGPPFPGYDQASLTFGDLSSIIRNDRDDWKTALQNMKGVYLITLANGQHYVGAAYGAIGVWSRWVTYYQTRDGGNMDLERLNHATDGQYIEDARFTLLEAWPMRTDDKEIIQCESYWKTALGSRVIGLNNN